MGKDPAVLWYFNDWAGGTATLSRHLKGCYMDLLYSQFNNGHLSLDEIKTVLGSDFGNAWPTLQKKFAKDANGLYFNERLVFEIDRRKNYTKSRKENLKGGDHMATHMENENRNEDIILKKEKEFVEKLQPFKGKYPKDMLINFATYWCEPNRSRTKLRHEMQPTWDVGRRLATWNKKDLEYGRKSAHGKQSITEALTEF